MKAKVKKILKSILFHPALSRYQIRQVVQAEELIGTCIDEMQILLPSEKVAFARKSDEEFLRICKYYNEGSFTRPEVFVCRLANANLHVGSGLLCTGDYRVIADSVMEYRLPFTTAYGRYKPFHKQKLSGTCTTIQNVFPGNHWHWLVDSLPRIHSLIKAMPDERLTLLLPDTLPGAHRESLSCLLPANFEVKYLKADSWVKPEQMVMASFVSSRANAYLPGEYLEFLRNSVFAKFGLPAEQPLRERIYISRAKARYRRLLGEDKVLEMLRRYGFKSYALEDMTFRQQVELFHRAECVVAPNGAGLGNILFSGKIKLLVLYPDRPPNTYFITQANALGQQHYFLADHKRHEFADFRIDGDAIEAIIKEQWGLTPLSARAAHR
jgi:hypothetical protein